MASPSIRVLQRSRDSAHSEPEPVSIDNPFNALDFRQPSLIQNSLAGCLASTIYKIEGILDRIAVDTLEPPSNPRDGFSLGFTYEMRAYQSLVDNWIVTKVEIL